MLPLVCGLQLQTEIKIHRGLNHKHVVKFEEVFEDKENVYIIMELCPQQTMLELVKRKKRLTEAETRRFMIQMLDGVKYMHSHKVIHRDLKLGNLFLGRGDEVKMGDFGLACKLAYDGERKRTLCGTPNYIAPEVLEGKNGHSYEVDTWSIGVVFYTCLVGKPPFETSDVKSTYKLIKSNTYSFPDRVHISESAKNLIRRILQSEPQHRPSIDEVLMDEWFQGEGIALVNASKGPASVAIPAPAKSISTTYSVSAAEYRAPLKPMSDNVDSKPASTKPYASDYGAHRYNDWDSRPTSATHSDAPSTATTVESRAIPSSTLASRPVSAIGGGYGKMASRGDTTPTKQLARAIGALDLHASKSPPKADIKEAGGPPNDGEDQQALYQMHLSIKNAPSGAVARSGAESLPLPSVWVSRWVDYSKKYGLGYKLSNGCSGVFFNDATKMLLETDGDSLAYIERMRRDDGSKYDVRKPNRLASYPTDLTKKVTLMEHFKNYLDETHPNRDSPVHVPFCAKETEDGKGVYVRKWMRTRHSIIFRLSNNNFQVNFFDDTEVVLWAEKRWVTYKGKNKVRATYELGEMGGVPELTKRIKYVTDILSQLVSRV